MDSFRSEIKKATGELGREDQNAAGVVLLGGTKSGLFIQETHGFKSLSQDAPPVDFDTTFWIASCTKLMTTVAALQLVEKGLVDLDEDITRVLHEWKNPTVLTDFDEEGNPVTKPAKNKLTLRHLLTHSGGLSYDFMNPLIQRYRQAKGLAPVSKGFGDTLVDTSLHPLLFEPGLGWEYSYSIDWAGVVVERLGGQGRLEEYMSKNIWEPLGITSATFRLNDYPDIRSNLVQMLTRDENSRVKTAELTLGFLSPHEFKFDAGGSGIYMKPKDYVKLLESLLKNDEVVLKKEMVELMFTPQLSDTKHLKEAIEKSGQDPHNALLGGLPVGHEYNFGLGGFLTLQDTPDKRKKGSLSWSGLPNLRWWIDPASGVYGLFSTQIMPFGDVPSVDLASKFEQALYKELKQ